MTIVRNILGRIFAAWALVTFLITFLIIYLPSMVCWMIPDPQGQKIFIGIARIWMRVWITLTGCWLIVKGKENFKKGKTYIVTCNHNSMMDIPLSSPFIPGANKTIAKSSFTKIPLFAFYYMKGAVLVDRKSEKSRKASFEKMKKVLETGIHMCIYPEGTRNRTTEPLKKFHDGAFKLAVNTGKAIIPTVIFNTKKVLPIDKTFYFWPGKLEMHFLPAIEVSTLNTDQLKEKVFTAMAEHYTTYKV